MSILAVAKVLRMKVGNHAQKLILLALADHHNESRGFCYPSIEKIMDFAEVSRSTAIAHLNALEEAGFIEKRTRFDATGRQTSNVYSLPFVDGPLGGRVRELDGGGSEIRTEEGPGFTRGEGPGFTTPITLNRNKEPTPLPPQGEACAAEADARQPEKPKETTPSKEKAKAKCGTRLPDDWALPHEWMTWATTEASTTEAAIKREAERFRDYWTAKSGAQATKRDWLATWRNWIRSASDRGQLAPAPSAVSSGEDWKARILNKLQNGVRN